MNHSAPGLYGDLLYRDGWVIVRSLIGSVVCPDWTADVTEHGHLMFLNIAMDPGTQQIYASGKANIGSNVVIVGPNGLKTVIPGGWPNYPSQLAVVNGQVVCYVVDSLSEYGMYALDGTLLERRQIPSPYQGTSEGISFVGDDGAIYWGKQTEAAIFEGLVIREWMQRAGYTGGQGQDGGFGLSGNGVSTLYPSGNTFFPRIAVHDQELALLYVNGASVCWDTLTLPLEVIPPAPPLPAPKVQSVTYDPLFKAGLPWQSTFRCVETDFIIAKDEQDHYTIEATNINGHDKTGLVRQLTVEGPEPTEPEPMSLFRFWQQSNIGAPDTEQMFQDASRLTGRNVCLYAQNILTDTTNPQVGPNIYPNLVTWDVFKKLKNLSIPLCVEMGSVKEWDCTAQSNITGMQTIVQRVADAGGQVAAFSQDEPLTSGLRHCGLTSAQVADRSANYTRAVRALGSILVGHLEAWPEVPLEDDKTHNDLVTYYQQLHALDALPDHFHPDVDWNRAKREGKDAAQFLRDAKAMCDRYGVTFGVFVNSTIDPIDPDKAHHDNLVALGNKIHGIAADPTHPLEIAHVHVASWASRHKDGPQDVPYNLGPYGMLSTFDAVRNIFDNDVPDQPDTPDPPLVELTDMMAYSAPILGFQPGQLEPHPDGNGALLVRKPNGKVVCVTPDGSLEERPNDGTPIDKYSAGPWEKFVKAKNGASLLAEREGGRIYVLSIAE